MVPGSSPEPWLWFRGLLLTVVPVLVPVLRTAMSSSAAAAAKPSLRSLLLLHLEHDAATGEHICLLTDSGKCIRTRFGPKSDSAAWKKHFALCHPKQLTALEATLARKRSANDAALDEVELRSSAASSSASAAPASGSSAASVSASASDCHSSKKARIAVASGPMDTLLRRFDRSKALELLVLALGSNSIPHSIVEDEDWREFLSFVGIFPLPSRRFIRESILASAAGVRSAVAELIENEVIAVAADGWTNVRRQKITNIVLMLKGQAFYWRSIVNNQANTAVWLAAQLLIVIHELTDVYKARVIGIVVDNEAVNAAAHKILQADLPFLIHIPCAAHTVQLVVRSCLDLPNLRPIVEQLIALIRFFDAKENRISLRRIQEMREKKTLCVLKPCDTRWNSLLIAAKRIKELHKEVITCYDDDSLPTVSSEFFTQLPTLIDFLEPFQVATDSIQRDTATLQTVFQQFAILRTHTLQNAWAFPCLQARWEKRIHGEAVAAVALLSFQDLPAHMNRRAAQNFIIEFGAAYVWYYSLHGDQESEEKVKDVLRSQLADFNGREGMYADLRSDIESSKRSAADKSEPWIPRKVWLLYTEAMLCTVALALLSCPASEAAVERTFSAQGLVHTKHRNALLNDAVESEMMLRVNRRTLAKKNSGPSYFGCVEMTVDVDSDAATVVPEKPEAEELDALHIDDDVVAPMEDDEVKESDMPAAAASAPPVAPSSARQRALRRAQSIVFETMPEFLDWFIRELKLTAHSKLNSDITNALERHSSKLTNSPGSATLITHLRLKLTST